MVARLTTTTCFVVCLAAVVAPAAALRGYQTRIPNGANVYRRGTHWPAVGHDAAEGLPSRNIFGIAFAAAGHDWTLELCRADTDGDGVSNGVELGDPNCTWTWGATPSRTTDISHPGFADSTPSFAPAHPGAQAQPTPLPTRSGVASLASSAHCAAPLARAAVVLLSATAMLF